jgi:ABC-2 type transport system ATP-binding protein
MKVREYLQFISEVKEVEDKELVNQIAEDVNINDVLNTKIEELSRGYKQRVGLAAALIGSPEILILDEPTSGLDPLEQDKIKDLIKKIAKEKTVIFSTHILSEVEDIANRLVIIKEGSVVYDGKKPTGKGEVERLFKNLMSPTMVVKKTSAVEKPKKTSRKKTPKVLE